MTDRNKKHTGAAEDWIDKLLDDTASASRPAPSRDFIARLLEDAYAAQDARAGDPSPKPLPARSRWSQVTELLGGRLGLGGLAAATCAGFILGIWWPSLLDAPLGLDGDSVALSEEWVDTAPMFTGFGWDLEEG